MSQRITNRARVHTALCAMQGVARHFYDGFYVGLKVEEPHSAAPPRAATKAR